MSETMTPNNPVRPVASPRAARLGVYPMARAVSRISSRTDPFTRSGRENARETVDAETPRLSAIESIVAFFTRATSLILTSGDTIPHGVTPPSFIACRGRQKLHGFYRLLQAFPGNFPVFYLPGERSAPGENLNISAVDTGCKIS